MGIIHHVIEYVIFKMMFLNYFVVAFLSAFTCSCYGKPAHHFERRTIEGELAIEGQFPYLVSLQQSNYHFCSGSLISANSVLTSIYCATRQNEDEVVTANFGGTNYNDPAQTILVASWEVSFEHDVAIATLSNDAQLDKKVSVISLFDNSNYGRAVTVPGWRFSQPTSKAAPYDMRYSNTTLISQSLCNEWWGSTDDDHHDTLCAGVLSRNGPCLGDVGSPLISIHNNVPKIIGIKSWSETWQQTICEPNYPSVFAKLTSSTTDWIQQNLE